MFPSRIHLHLLQPAWQVIQLSSDVQTRPVMPELATSLESKTADASTKMAQAMRNLQCAVTQSHEAIFITDAAGLISRVNPAFEKLTDYSSIEVIGKDMSLLIAGGPQSDDYRQIWNRIFQQRPFSGPVQLKNKSGEPCDSEMTLTPLSDIRGHIINVVCSFQKMHVAEAVPDDTAHSTHLLEVAHRLNNALLTLMAYADLTCDAFPAEHPLRSRMQDMKAGAHRAANLGRLLLDFEPVKTAAANPGSAIPDPENLKADSDASLQHAGPRTLLVVEDETAVRQSMVEFLSQSGYNVLAAGSGEEALERSKAAAIDLVITDVALPRMDGQQLAGVLTAFHPLMKVLFVSGFSQSAVLQRDAPGLNRSFLQKPFSLAALAEKVDGVLTPSPKPRTIAAAAG
jgi:PAS domain S-box-containing protein